jgi:hypothetical protein
MAISRDSRTAERTVQAPTKGGLLWLTVGGMVALTVGLFVVLTFGRVSGVEFSPQLFQRRSYTFFQIPAVRWQVTPAWRHDETLTLEQHLRQQRLLPHRSAPARWDVVWAAEGDRRHEGNPIILTRYLDVTDANREQHWYAWTKEHPELAKILWSAVQRAATLEAYELIPPLFELAAAGGSPDELQHRINGVLSENLADLADDLAAAGDTAAAERLHKALLDRTDLDAGLRGQLESRPGRAKDG